MPVQCKQCGLRFSDTAQGKKTMQEHLDMHFRQNRKASQSVGRGHSRSWFLGAEVSSARVFLSTEFDQALCRTGSVICLTVAVTKTQVSHRVYQMSRPLQ